MNISVIYGTTKNECTYNCVQLFLSNLKLTIPINIKEFFLTKTAPNYSRDFFICHVNGNIIYPNSNPIDYLINSLDNSDLIILASPVIQCDITTELSSLLNYLFFNFMERNAKSFMKHKIGLAISTTSGAGLCRTTSNLKKNLFLWGIHDVLRLSQTIYEKNWEDVNLKTRIKINKKIIKLSNKVLEIYLNSPMKNTVSNEIISYKFAPILKSKNVLNIEFRKKHIYDHRVSKIH